MMTKRAVPAVLALACAAIACTPALDWREVRPEGSGLLALFPCKPDGHARSLVLAETVVEMTLYACSAGGATYAVGFADLGQPQRVERALAELSAAAARNVGSTDTPAATPVRVDGMTPNPRAERRTLVGQLSDGRPVQEQVAVFARASRVFQVTVVGMKLDSEAVETFFSALRLPA